MDAIQGIKKTIAEQKAAQHAKIKRVRKAAKAIQEYRDRQTGEQRRTE